ncbi:MAG: hypothetical protein P4L79_17000 [Legionella sp.]|uniref:hypothetical protein n=1 Tax=Legionella sp. TaxID=459 RepID=UPI00283D6E88|nr:hypothetical protein [Legionella sp.]
MGSWPVIEKEEDIFTFAPNFDLLKNQNELSHAQLISLLHELNNASSKFSAQELEDSYFFPWLTFAMGCAVKLSGMNPNLPTTPFILITSITQSILNKAPDVLYTMFDQQISQGSFKGQSFAYFWMDNYHSLVYSQNDDLSSLHALNIMFHELLNVWGAKFCSLLVKNIEEGSEKGKNALLVLLRSYQKSAGEINNLLQTQLIAELFHQCMQKEPSLMGAALTQEITEGLFRGKSSLYLLSCILLKTTSFGNSDSVTIIQDVMLQALKNHPEQFMNALYKRHALGVYPGLSSFHLILLSLVEASYKEESSAVIAQLMRILTELTTYDKSEETAISALLETIEDGAYQNLNGFVFLCRALIAAIAHQIDVTSMMDFILDVIKGAPAEQLTTAVFQSAPAHPTPEYRCSPINHVINLARDMNRPIHQKNAQVIINALAHSQAASQIHSLLPSDEQFFFVNETNLKPKSLFRASSAPILSEVGESSSNVESSYGSTQRLFHSNIESASDVVVHFSLRPM